MADIAVLSGPSHAEEVSKGVPTTVVVGAKSEKTGVFIQGCVYERMFPCIHQPGYDWH